MNSIDLIFFSFSHITDYQFIEILQKDRVISKQFFKYLWYNKYLFLDTENIYIHNALAVQAYSVYVHGSNAHRQESAVNELIKQEALIQVIFNQEKKNEIDYMTFRAFLSTFC